MAVTQVFRQFLATNFPVRAKALARAIASKKPAFIGLQEAEVITLTIPTFGTVTYDFVELLLEELENRGLHYKVAAQNDKSKFAKYTGQQRKYNWYLGQGCHIDSQ